MVKKIFRFLDSTGISTNILAIRLKFLMVNRIIEKTPYQLKPVRYEYKLTPRGRAVKHIIKSMIKWAVINETSCI